VGAYQLMQQNVPAAIVVSESVSEVKKREGEAPSKFANALLRKVADTARSWRELPFPGNASMSERAAWASVPEWFWKRIESQHGLEWAKRFAESSLERPKLWTRIAGQLEPQVAAGGSVAEMDGFAEGKFFVQDISSQILVTEVSAIVKQSVKERFGRENPSVLDLCSAPGGKAIGLAWNGFQVLATDADSGRLARVRENSRRLQAGLSGPGGNLRIIERAEANGLELQDLVWVDAPCSGSGIIRRHPDVRWLRKEKNLEGLARLQRELVREAWGKVREGGFLAYSVCSVFHEEGPEVLRDTELEGSIVKSWLLCPQDAPHGDGFWAALAKKK